MTRRLTSPSGQAITLGKKIGEGGEGEVWEVVGRADVVAKTYKTPPDASRSTKLAAMVSSSLVEMESISWPTELLIQPGRARSPTGFLMKRVPAEFKPIMKLYSPGYRKVEFPGSDWRLLLTATENLARVTANLHHLGQCIGDLNHSNIMVAPNGRVWLIDADSFSFSCLAGSWNCEVGVQEFLAPELQGRDLSSVQRGQDQDSFSMAILAFLLLFLGRHPFAGVHEQEQPEIGEAIRRKLFAFSSKTGSVYSPPPNALSMEAVGIELAGLFERSFLSDSPGERPTSAEWVASLERARAGLVHCSQDHNHYFLQGLPACPWCQFETRGITLFPSTTGTLRPPQDPQVSGSEELLQVDAEALWQAILGVRGPPSMPRSITIDFPQLPARYQERHSQGESGNLGIVAGLVFGVVGLSFGGCFGAFLAAGIGGGLTMMVYDGVVDSLRKGKNRTTLPVRQAHERLAAAHQRLKSVVSNGQDEWKRTYAELEHSRRAIENPQTVFTGRVRDAERKDSGYQVDAWLQTQFIEDANIDGIGPGRMATLRSWGIETAADILNSGGLVQSLGHHGALGGAPSCPQCGSVMRLRLARRGRNRGNHFWGCSRYPSCRGTRSHSSPRHFSSRPAGSGIRSIPGFGEVLSGNLTRWASRKKDSYRPQLSPDRHAAIRAGVTQELNEELRAHAQTLTKGPAVLKRIADKSEAQVAEAQQAFHAANAAFRSTVGG